MWFGRNYEKRQELFLLCKSLDDKKDKELEELDNDLSITEEEYEKRISELFKRYDTIHIYKKITSLEYPVVRNEWFCKFVKSFGICDSKEVSYKQAEIFRRYCERSHDNHYSVVNNSYANVLIEGKILFVTFTDFARKAYVTVEEIKAIAKQNTEV